MNTVDEDVRTLLIRTGQLTPRSTEKRFSDGPTPQRWFDLPTLRLDGLGARESKRDISMGGNSYSFVSNRPGQRYAA